MREKRTPRTSAGRLGIIAIKNERTQIHFLSDVFIAVASLDLKAPNRQLTGSGHFCLSKNMPWRNQICMLSVFTLIETIRLRIY